jgi:hypothetical protein
VGDVRLPRRLVSMTFLRYTLRVGASVFGLSAIALILAPSLFLGLLGMEGTPPLVWSMVLIGVTLVALTGNMAVVSFAASDRGVQAASVVMMLAAGGLGVTTLLIPVPLTWFSIIYALIGFGFSTVYVVGLTRASLAR